MLSGFRLRAPAPLTPAKRLKFKSLRVRQFFAKIKGPLVTKSFPYVARGPGRDIRGYVCIGSLRRFSSTMLG